MRNQLIAFIVIVILLSGGLFFVWYKYERPVENLYIDYTNLSISAVLDDQNIKTGFIVKQNGFLFTEGETLTDGSILVSVPVNFTYEISTVNLDGQHYYNSKKIIDIKQKIPYQAKLLIIEPGSIKVTHSIDGNSVVHFKIQSQGPYNDISYCVDWSHNIISVKNLEGTLSNGTYYPEYIKCIDTGVSLNDNSLLVNLKYKKWDTLTQEDYIKIYFFDKNYENNTIMYKNIGGKDIEYSITKLS